MAANTIPMTYRLLALLLLAFLPSLSAYSQIISTYAGTGIAGYSGDGGTATAGQMHSPIGLAVDRAGNLYVAERINNIIRKISPSGTITTFAGNGTSGYSGDGGPATNARLNRPHSIAVDRNDNVYFTDNGNNKIRRVDLSGTITTVPVVVSVSIPGGYIYSIQNPTGIAIDDSDYVYFSNTDWRVVLKFNGSYIAKIVAGDASLSYTGDGGPATLAALNNPNGLACDHSGNIFICDIGNNVVRKINSAGIITRFAGNGATGAYYGDGGPATLAGLFGPVGVATDQLGNVLIQDIYNRRIRMVDLSGNIRTVAGNGVAAYAGDGGPATNASFYYCTGLAVDLAGDFYISDLNFSVIRKVTGMHVLDVPQSTVPENSLVLFPNPNNGVFNLRLTMGNQTSTGEDISINVFDMLGRVVYTNNMLAKPGVSELQIAPATSLSTGVYILYATAPGYSQAIRFAVEK